MSGAGKNNVRDQKTPEQSRKYRLKSKYGLSEQGYDQMFQAQKGLYAICKTPEAECPKHRLFVDHCHNTDAIRGLLCSKCNAAIGLLGDDVNLLMAAKDYIESH